MEYTIKQVKTNDIWSNNYGEFQSYALVLEGIGEPVSMNKKVPVENPPKIGDKLFGKLEMMSAKSGRNYYKFKTETRPEQSEKPSEEYWEEKNRTIRAQWAIGQAVNEATAINEAEAYKDIEKRAKEFFLMVDRVRKTEVAEDQQSEKPNNQVAETPAIDDEPINLDDIPF